MSAACTSTGEAILCRIVVALIAQFYPKKHPENWNVLLVCLVLYCIGSTFLSLFSALYEEDACFITRPKKVCPE